MRLQFARTLTHGRVCVAVMLLSFTWVPVELSDWVGWSRDEAPKVPTLTRDTRCAKDTVPEARDGSSQAKLPRSSQYCLKWFNRRESKITDSIYNISVLHLVDHLGVAMLHNIYESNPSQVPQKCHKSETLKTNPLERVQDKECLENQDENESTCATQLAGKLRKVAFLLSTEKGKQSLPSCDEFEDYTENDSQEAAATNAEEVASSKLRVIRNRQTSNVSVHSMTIVVDGDPVLISKRVMGYGVLADWFSVSDCPNDVSFGVVDASVNSYPSLHLDTDMTIIKGSSTATPGHYLHQIQANLTRTWDSEGPSSTGVEKELSTFGGDFKDGGGGGRRVVGYFNAEECNVVVETEDEENDTEKDPREVLEGKNKINQTDFLSEDMLMKVKPEINELDEDETGAAEVDEQGIPRYQGCKISTEEFAHLEKYFGVEPNTFVRSVLRHYFSSPVYSSVSNRTKLEPTPGNTVGVIEQVANSTALPAFDYALKQVNHDDSHQGGWERVVALGSRTSMAVGAEYASSMLNYYNKTFTFFNVQGPLLVHILFIDRTNFTVRLERPLSAWQIMVQLEVPDNRPLYATFRVAEMNQFLSYHEHTHTLLNATFHDSGQPGVYKVRWQLTADPNRLTELIAEGRNLLDTGMSRSAGDGKEDGLLDLLKNIATGSTSEEQRRGEEIIREDFKKMVMKVWKKMASFSATGPEDAPDEQDDLWVLGRAVWDALTWTAVVSEEPIEDEGLGEFLLDVGHYLDLCRWVLEWPTC